MKDASEIELEEAGYDAAYLNQREPQKTCARCKTPKPLEAFYHRGSWCKECTRAYMRDRTKKNQQAKAACTCGALAQVPTREPTLHELGLKWVMLKEDRLPPGAHELEPIAEENQNP